MMHKIVQETGDFNCVIALFYAGGMEDFAVRKGLLDFPVSGGRQMQEIGEYDIICLASHGYQEHFIRKGVRPERIAVSGILNFDDLASVRQNELT